MTASGRSDVEVDEDSGVIRGGVDRLGHLGVMLEERTVLAAPHALSEDPGPLDPREELRREQDVVDLLRLRRVAERARSAIVLEVLVDAHIAQVQTLRKQWRKWCGVRCVVEVANHGDARYAGLTADVVDLSHPLGLPPPTRVRVCLSAEPFALEVVDQDEQGVPRRKRYLVLRAIAAEDAGA